MRNAFFIVLILSASACSKPAPQPTATPAPAAAASTSAPVPVGTVKEIMKGIVDPSSKGIWDAVGTESGPKGIVEKAPKTKEEWEAVENSALTLAEVANLLKVPGRHFARPEEANTKTNPDAPELTPAQMEEKANKDRAMWEQRADALRETAVKALAAARAHDKDGILNVGEEIDNACESCHKVYWYPDDAAPSASPAPAAKS